MTYNIIKLCVTIFFVLNVNGEEESCSHYKPCDLRGKLY